MHKKQGIIEQKITTKPSFKNLFDIERSKIPSRSKSKNKSISQKKVSAIPYKKSPSKISQTSVKVEGEDKGHKDSSQKSITSSPKSVKKNERNNTPEQSNMKKIINLKNKVNRLEQSIAQQEQALREISRRNENERKSKDKAQNSFMVQQSTEKLEKMKNFLDQYLKQLKTQTNQIQQSYHKKIDEIQSKDAESEMEIFRPKNFKKPQPNMKNLQGKLGKLQRLLI